MFGNISRVNHRILNKIRGFQMASETPSLIVKLKQGQLRGTENQSVFNAQTYYSFFGIPYAKPPEGDLRFKAPQSHDGWEGVYDATYERDSCIQKDYFHTRTILGKEDCLFINVHTPEVPSEIKDSKAVLVFIHGGGFFSGSGSQKIYSADFLITKDVIMVTFNYRLHVLGFLNLGIPDCPGNAGLKDQTLALKWVKENIQQFGGDPNNITIFGESAGASSVQFHIISPLSKGLFNRAIIQSGSVLVPWAMTFDPQNMAEEFGKNLGFEGGSTQELLTFLKNQTIEELARVANDMTENLKHVYPGRCTSIPFSPSVETIKEGAFLPDLPEELLKTASPVPLIYGANNKEGCLLFAALTDDIIPLLQKDFSLVLKYNFKIDPSVLPDVSAKVKQYYFGDKEVGLETAEQLVDLYTDIYFYQMYDAIDFVTSSSIPPYVYEFSYFGCFNMFAKIFLRDRIKIEGASHGDDLGYLFFPKMINPPPSIEGDDRTVIENLVTMWTNFAKTGKPADELIWVPSTSKQPRYLEIDAQLALTDGTVYGKRLQFLRETLGPVAKPYNIF